MPTPPMNDRRETPARSILSVIAFFPGQAGGENLAQDRLLHEQGHVERIAKPTAAGNNT